MARKEPLGTTKRPPKTLKERRFVKVLPTADSLADAVRKAGYKVKNVYSASQIGYENMKKLEVGIYLHNAGLTLETMAQNTARIALTAKKQNQFTGEIDDDNMMQLKAMEFGAKLYGIGKTDEGSTTNNYLQFIQNQNNGYRPEDPV